MSKENKEKGRPWTNKDLKELKSLVKAGKNNDEIGAYLGRTPGAISFQKSVNGFTIKRKKSDKENKKSEKAKELGKIIDQAIPEANNDRKDWSKEEDKNLRKMAKDGFNIHDIAYNLGRSVDSVRSRCYRENIHFSADAKRIIKKSKVAKMTKEGINKEVAVKKVVAVKKDVELKVKNKEGKKVEVEGSELRGKVKDIVKYARSIARSGGKRITMAMFFVEDLDE